MNTEPHTHYCPLHAGRFECPWAADGGCIFPSTDHITCNECAEKAHALTPTEQLEPHRFFWIPERAFLVGSPTFGRIKFTRHRSNIRDARGRETTASVEIITERRYEQLPTPICVHSPTGLEWGYGGSGPADCAANILALFVSLPEAWRLHQEFKPFVAAIDQEAGGHIPVQIVRAWLEEAWAKEQADPDAMQNEAELLRLVEEEGAAS